MLFWIILIACVAFGVLAVILSDNCVELPSVISGFMSIVTGFTALVMLIVIIANHVGIDAKIDRCETRYEMLTCQYESDIYENDNDLGKRELIVDIQEWNEDLAYRKNIQRDLWLGIFHPNIYDQFEFIELGGAS